MTFVNAAITNGRNISGLGDAAMESVIVQHLDINNFAVCLMYHVYVEINPMGRVVVKSTSNVLNFIPQRLRSMVLG